MGDERHEDYKVGDDTWNISYSDLEFTPDGKIGSGNFAKVLCAKYYGTPVAVKKILEPGGDMEKYVERELALLKHLRHPNIVQFIGVSKHRDEIFIVTEFCGKGNLKTLLYGKPEASLSWRRRIKMATDIARGLVYLNEKRFIHRDLKSDNCLVDDDGKIKLCDFGMARSTKRHESPKMMTICGTDEWMAPEVMLGEPYDIKADVYSTGIVLTELITRKKPLLRKPLDNFAYPIADFKKIVPADCPPGFVELALDCVKNDPPARPDFKEVLARLQVLEKTASSRDLSEGSHRARRKNSQKEDGTRKKQESRKDKNEERDKREKDGKRDDKEVKKDDKGAKRDSNEERREKEKEKDPKREEGKDRPKEEVTRKERKASFSDGEREKKSSGKDRKESSSSDEKKPEKREIRREQSTSASHEKEKKPRRPSVDGLSREKL